MGYLDFIDGFRLEMQCKVVKTEVDPMRISSDNP